jgi:hypothetical protein
MSGSRAGARARRLRRRVLKDFGVLVAAAAMMTTLTQSARAQDYRETSGSRELRGEKDLSVDVTFGIGDLNLTAAPAATLYRFNLLYDADHFRPIAQYDAAGHRLHVGVDGNSHGEYHYRDRPKQRLDLSLSPTTPTSLDLTFGAGTADLALGGLSLRDIHLKGGAAQTTLSFDQPNRITCGTFILEVGAIDLTTEKLGNARCDRIELKGGASSVVLDLTGQWPNGTSEVDVTVGVGSVTLRLPESVGVEADVDRFLTTFDRSGLLRRGSSYYSASWDSAKTKLHLNVKAAMGEVNVEWVK